MGVPTTMQGEASHWGMTGRAAVIFMVLNIAWSSGSMSFKSRAGRRLRCTLGKCVKPCVCFAGFQVQLAPGNWSGAGFVYDDFRGLSRISQRLFTVLSPTIPPCVCWLQKLHSVRGNRFLHDGFTVQLSIIVSLL